MSDKQRYYKFNGAIEEYPGCCGIDVYAGLDLDENNYRGGYTKEQVFKDLLKQIGRKRGCRHVQLSFVTEYSKQNYNWRAGGQAPGLKEFLLEHKWKVVDEFLAPRHGNTVCVMSKLYPAKRIKKSVLNNIFARNW